MSLKQKLQIVFDKNKPGQTLFNMAWIVFLFAQLCRFGANVVRTQGYDSSHIPEFLINYRGGFVRRGLTGEILYFLSVNFNINVEWAVKIFCIAAFAAVCVFFVRSFLKKGYSLYILPICFFLGMGPLSSCWLRKDYFLAGVFIVIVWIFESGRASGKSFGALRVALINALFIIAALSHESITFFALPILFMLFLSLYRSKCAMRGAALSLLCLLPSVLAVCLIAFMHGNHDTASAIWDSWAERLNLDPAAGTAMPYLDWTIWQLAASHIRLNILSVNAGIWATLAWLVIFPAVYYIATNVLFAFRKNAAHFTEKHRDVLGAVLIFQMLCMLPLFALLFHDFIRLSFFWIASSFAVFLLIPLEKLETLFPAFYTNAVGCVNKIFASILPPSKHALVLLMMFIGIPVVGYSVMGVVKTTALYNIMMVLSTPVTILTGNFHQLLNW